MRNASQHLNVQTSPGTVLLLRYSLSAASYFLAVIIWNTAMDASQVKTQVLKEN